MSQYVKNKIRIDGVLPDLEVQGKQVQNVALMDDRGQSPGHHKLLVTEVKEPDKRVEKRRRPSDPDDLVTDLVTDGNGYKFEHSKKAYLILNLYAGHRDGYTYAVYLPETIAKEAVLYRESHLIPYSETYLLDCIDCETIPHRLVSTLEREHSINLIHYPNCVVCEVRDFRHFPSTGNPIQPLHRRVVLKPTTESIFTDLERLIMRSYENRNLFRNGSQQTKQHQSSNHELISFKRMRLTNPNYPFDRYKEDMIFVGLDAEMEDRDELTLDQRLELEKKIVKETSRGLCLDPSKNVGRIANCAQFERFKWNSKELRRSLRVYSRKKHRSRPLLPQSCVLTEDDYVDMEGKSSEKENGAEFSLSTEEEISVNPIPANFRFQESRSSCRRGATALLNFINRSIQSSKLKRNIDSVHKSQAMKLLPIKQPDYSHAPALTSLEEIRALSQPAEPASIRQLFSENYVTKTEEYVFETERRKHPHRTVVNIYQRNGGENYFGELEQEALDEPNTADSSSSYPIRGTANTISIKPFALDPPTNTLSGSKCQFDLGSSHSVNLYVKQFTDIFTEDGRRPCKITFHKAGQAGPTVLCTSSYKTQMNGNNNSTALSSPPPNAVGTPPISGVHVGANVIIAHSGAPTPPHSSNAIIVSVPSLPHSGIQTPSTISIPVVNPAIGNAAVANAVPPVTTTSSSSSPSQTTPPVQIVHPQPRLQPSIQISTASQLYAAGIQGLTTASYTPTTSVINQASPTTVSNSARIVQHHQLLTRPKIYNVNLTPKPPLTMTRPAATVQQAPQLVHALSQQQQQGLRVKQLGVARLLLGSSGLQNSASKPITVIQPQPQQNQTLNHSSTQVNVNQVQTIQLNNPCLEAQHQLSHQTSQVQIATHPHQGTQSNNQIMIMLASPANGSGQSAISIPAGNTALSRQGGNVSLNLSTINLDGLLAVSNNSITSLQQQPHTYVTSTALVNSSNSITNSLGINTVGVSNASLNTVNIVRYSNTSGTVTLQPQQVLRQNSVSVMNPQQQTAILTMNSSPTTGIIVNNSHNMATTAVANPVRLQQTIRQQPELEEISVPDLNTLLNNGCGPTRAYGRASTNKGPSIDVNLNVNLNLSGAPTPTGISAAQAPTMSEIYSSGRQQNGSMNVNSVDSIFNALSEAMGPDLEQKLENSLVKSNTRLSTSTSTISQKSSVMTLNDLLGSPPMSATGSSIASNHVVSSPMQSPQSPSISSILSPISPNVATSSIAYTTPRLSALLAGTPSADSSQSVNMDTSPGRGNLGSGNCGGNLFDRLLSQGQTVAVPVQRTGGSRLNPIATATPSVALDHPVLAATLTQGTNPNLRHALTRPTTYRQIAPAPPPILQPSVSSQQQQQQLINNLLGLMGSNTGNQASQPQAIRISKSNQSNTGGSGHR